MSQQYVNELNKHLTLLTDKENSYCLQIHHCQMILSQQFGYNKFPSSTNTFVPVSSLNKANTLPQIEHYEKYYLEQYNRWLNEPNKDSSVISYVHYYQQKLSSVSMKKQMIIEKTRQMEEEKMKLAAQQSQNYNCEENAIMNKTSNHNETLSTTTTNDHDDNTENTVQNVWNVDNDNNYNNDNFDIFSDIKLLGYTPAECNTVKNTRIREKLLSEKGIDDNNDSNLSNSNAIFNMKHEYLDDYFGFSKKYDIDFSKVHQSHQHQQYQNQSPYNQPQYLQQYLDQQAVKLSGQAPNSSRFCYFIC